MINKRFFLTPCLSSEDIVGSDIKSVSVQNINLGHQSSRTSIQFRRIIQRCRVNATALYYGFIVGIWNIAESSTKRGLQSAGPELAMQSKRTRSQPATLKWFKRLSKMQMPQCHEFDSRLAFLILEFPRPPAHCRPGCHERILGKNLARESLNDSPGGFSHFCAHARIHV